MADDRDSTLEARLAHGHEVTADRMSQMFAPFSVPRVSLDTENGGTRYRGDLTTPFMGGELGFEGNYLRPQYQGQPPEWGAMLRYRRQF
jgi:hypothetical protein